MGWNPETIRTNPPRQRAKFHGRSWITHGFIPYLIRAKDVETYLQRASGLASADGYGESSYYGHFTAMVERVCNAEGWNYSIEAHLNLGNKFPDFSMFRGDLNLDIHTCVEAKKPGEDIQAMIATSQGDDKHQFSVYLTLCRYLIVTNFSYFALLRRNPGGETEIVHEIDILNGAALNGLDINANVVNDARQRFQGFLQVVFELPSPDPANSDGVRATLSRLAAATRDSILYCRRPEAPAHLQAIANLPVDSMKRLTPGQSLEAHAGLCGQLLSSTLLIMRGRTADEEDIDAQNDGFLRSDDLRVAYRGIVSFADFLGLGSLLGSTTRALNQVADLGLDSDRELESWMINIAEFMDPDWVSNYGFAPTPDQVVSYIISRADRSLRENDDFSDGLGTDNQEHRAIILDPCIGSGRFYIDVIKRIYAIAEGNDLAADACRERVLRAIGTEEYEPRIHGTDKQPMCVLWTELLLERYLDSIGVDTDRIRPSLRVADSLSAGVVGQGEPIEPHVVLGNPPWGSHHDNLQLAANLNEQLREHVVAYNEAAMEKRGHHHSKVNKEVGTAFTLKFLRDLSSDQHPCQVLCFVVPSAIAFNEVWYDARRSMLQRFQMHIDVLDGDVQSGDGNNVFGNLCAIGNMVLLARSRTEAPEEGAATLSVRDDFTGMTTEDKLARLNTALAFPYDEDAVEVWEGAYEVRTPIELDWFKFRVLPFDHDERYVATYTLSQHHTMSPMQEKRRNYSVNANRQTVVENMQNVLGDDENMTWEAAQGHNADYCNTITQRRWDLARPFDDGNIGRYCITPMNPVYAYVHNNLWAADRGDERQLSSGPGWIIIPAQTDSRLPNPGMPVLFTNFFPAYQHVVYANGRAMAFGLTQDDEGVANLSPETLARFEEIYGEIEDPADFSHGVWYHALAVLSAEDFGPRVQYLEQDVTIPIPNTLEVFENSVAVGRTIAELQALEINLTDGDWNGIRQGIRNLLIGGEAPAMRLTNQDGEAVGIEGFRVSGYHQTNSYRTNSIQCTEPTEEEEEAFSDFIVPTDEEEQALGNLNSDYFMEITGGVTTLQVMRNGNQRLHSVPHVATCFDIGNQNGSSLQRWLAWHSETNVTAYEGMLTELRIFIINITTLALLRDTLNENLTACTVDAVDWSGIDVEVPDVGGQADILAGMELGNQEEEQE